MKILLINKFLYPKGGDAISTLTTGTMLSKKGHEVIYWGMEAPENEEFPYKEYFVSHVDYDRPSSLFRQLKLSFNIFYSFEARDKMNGLLKKVRPDIVHLNNFAHQISPSILDVFKKQNIPVVMTLRDLKLVCPYWYSMLNGRPCEKCKDGKYYWCFINRCTKGSFSKSLVNTVEMYLHHKILHIYDLIEVFISPSMFVKEKVKEMGFRREPVFLPNFIDAGDYIPEFNPSQNVICYLGRLSAEKGLFVLLDAIKGMDIKLKIIGEGPLEKGLKSKVERERIGNVWFLGYKKGEELRDEVRKSMAVVLPSVWYENNPRSVIESFALGKPVIGSRIGGIPELVEDGITGLTFEPGNPRSLREKIEALIREPDKIIEMGKNARRFVETKLNPEVHYQELMKIYSMAIEKNK
jgi:glycosyltransferase involved in cell wall biosynthesis